MQLNLQKKDWAPIPLRLMIGFGFIYHGYPKVFSSAGHEMFLGMLQNIGVPMPEIAAWGVGFVEFFGGIALIVGVCVGIVAILNIINMLVAMFTVHLDNGFNFMKGGFEINLLYIAPLISLLIMGAGRCSVEYILEKKKKLKEQQNE